jgi:2'-5' RNA ligase
MTQDAASGYRAGATGLIVKAAEAEPVVARWRSTFDGAAAAGIPAHMTVLYPFLDQQLIDATVRSELGTLLAKHQAFDVELRECRRFPGVLYLAPVPDTEMRALTSAVSGRWPEAPPYGGQFADVIPHLTVADGQEIDVLDMIESDISSRLPIAVHVASVHLVIYTGGHWHEEQRFPLAAR